MSNACDKQVGQV